jgi:hypothetical protein
MKLTEAQEQIIKGHWGDWEAVHMEYDNLIEKRLIQLDPEFVESLEDAVEGAKFWYA